MARCDSSLCDLAALKRVDDSNVKSCASSSCPVRNEDIPRSCFCSREQISFLPGGSQASSLSCRMKGISECVVSGNSLALVAT